jgi:diguanylate cyclase (GGDEF)-like protein
MADLDGLKIVNDRDGHAAGDLLIQKAGRALSNAMRAEDAIIRFGGDEFAVI